jgi:hypothetical protein
LNKAGVRVKKRGAGRWVERYVVCECECASIDRKGKEGEERNEKRNNESEVFSTDSPSTSD